MATWTDAAACRREDPELFFPIGCSAEFAPEIEKAKAVCRACPVVEDCLREAINAPERYGVWGGLDEQERAVLRRRDLRRAHPRFIEREAS
jgi:WhiB family redox-sensing transcriptional regulator